MTGWDSLKVRETYNLIFVFTDLMKVEIKLTYDSLERRLRIGSVSKLAIIRTMALILVASATLFASMAMGEVPQMINYQGRLSDSGGNPIDTTINMTFTICLDSAGGVCIWGETHATVEVVNGLFNVKLGQTTPLTATVFSNDNLWLHFAVGSAKEAIDPPVELITFPFAYHAARADTVDYVSNSDSSGSIRKQ